MIDSKLLISIIINCFNGEKFLRETIDSVVNQTYTNWEIIFWDNQSTDSTAEIVQSYKDNRIRYFYAPNHTPLGEARNLAMKEAKGDYIGFLDADDVWTYSFLETYANYANQNPAASLIYSKYKAVFKELKWYSNNRQKAVEIPVDVFVKHYDVGMSSAIFKREIIENFQIKFDNRFSLIEDYDFFIRIGVTGNILSIPEPLMIYRYHEDNLSRSDKWCDELSLLLNLSISKTRGYENHYPFVRIFWILRNHYKVYQLIKQSKKLEAMKIILHTSIYDFRFLRLLVALVGGVDIAKKIRSLYNR